jgi:glutamine synthetase
MAMSLDTRPLSLEQLKVEVAGGTIDTVLLGFADMQGRLQGKRLAAAYFLDEVLEHAAEGCSYLLAVDVDMNTVPGYASSSWDTGYGDFVLRPDLGTLHRVPWHPGTAGVLAELENADGSPVAVSPRQILARQTGGSPSAAGRRTRARSWSSWCSGTRTSTRGRPATTG